MSKIKPERIDTSDETDKEVAKNIITRRKAMGLSQKDLAVKATISQVTLNQIENRRKSAGRHSLEHISRVLNCNRHDLTRPTEYHYVKPSPTLQTVIYLLVEFLEASEDTRGKVFEVLKRS